MKDGKRWREFRGRNGGHLWSENHLGELIEMENVVLMPHVGSASIETRRAMDQLVADNIISWFAGKGPLTPVPETPVTK